MREKLVKITPVIDFESQTRDQKKWSLHLVLVKGLEGDSEETGSFNWHLISGL